MQILQGKKIVLGITGGIAAYKTPELVRRLKDNGADVRVVMTTAAKAFITPLTLQAVSANGVSDSLLDSQAELAMGHIELAKWADFILIAPATADAIARITCGMANDLLTTLCLATSAPIAIAPAMNQQMWHAAITQENIAKLISRKVAVFGPGSGAQACGDVGLGRMLDVDLLVSHVCQFFQPASKIAQVDLSGQRWVITAGPTREAIDPVRYISNHSSGKMGYAIAQAAQLAGAEVQIISGPVSIAVPHGCKKIAVESALQMHQQALELAKKADVFVACAAVADYRVSEVATQKIKKSADEMQLILVKNPDIVADVAALSVKPFTIGFAAETQDVAHYALDKLKRKNLDMIAANNVALSGQGFNSDDNALTVFSNKNKTELPLASKKILAEQLVQLISQHYVEKK
ncbi:MULTISPECIES: bifunctional phosphopantothenoylcysteine decarboxylase/phosphopantothenate--cysteine ligase CoaBC [unclassified Colwellia]|uniref:bifunctional phosphopantothenoylcysteine decarboxylase/phosphopantothenate--cysteine ligase CoaBC n=1 Tax=unclassified Colwellia TaxID=196834 RepID=UPI0015F3AA4F|nr:MULTISPECIES: bifunctional phosphopantothenoylcysteine decarboxylase/phosphopantothenate--cysteine ligase CoaBC [unclassified Colwellia]MBA6355237.1 bifunctional phosphopantothenoylcysteine decarboxylase/phosphopantothenate--cysteine ligase CoaBC [Colwellia sp. BRX8-3]MBA6358869.1 bifunctional phosphopantothenoylcysteine decarboxylase/phosphopantothenate--cysteine ligase CoaBC [Colwellia sp. BRX8-6]MBA6366383.1 bifunctional phosphopantothenoylcysteine decarboxylase/phosphopantothenate--cystei